MSNKTTEIKRARKIGPRKIGPRKIWSLYICKEKNGCNTCIKNQFHATSEAIQSHHIAINKFFHFDEYFAVHCCVATDLCNFVNQNLPFRVIEAIFLSLQGIFYSLQSYTGPVQWQNRIFPEYYFHTGKNLFSIQGSQVSITGRDGFAVYFLIVLLLNQIYTLSPYCVLVRSLNHYHYTTKM